MGVLFPTVIKYMKKDTVNSTESLYSEWLGNVAQIDSMNRLLNDRSIMLTRILGSWGFKSCILKGQGVAQLYPEPYLRQGGDIDIWIEGDQDRIIKDLKSHCIGIRSIDYVHSSESIFPDVEVEMHFRPSWMYNPFKNIKLQTYFKENAKTQFDNYDKKMGFAYPTVSFNLVYSLVHINRHVFEEGIGLRQLLDYYYIIKHSSSKEREEAIIVIKSLGLLKFTGAIMYILHRVFGLDQDYLLCSPNISEGSFLLEEINRGGNFGRYDERNKWIPINKRFIRGWYNTKRNLRYLSHYPNEVVWIPVWKIWHYCWRKCKGYL